jgi:peptidoglycan/LPS O-acetylase OafA/YrhL
LRRILHLSFPSTLHAALFFMAGSLLYLLRDRIVLRPAYGFAAFALLAAAARTPHFYLIALATLPYLVFCLGFARAPRLAGFRRGGDPSYGLYVYAFPVQQTLAHAAPGIAPLALFALALPIVAALAYLSWFLVERPCLRFGRKLFAKPAATPQVAPRRAA